MKLVSQSGNGLEVRLEHLYRDVRGVARSLRRNPAFTVAVILTFALGIGANTAVFSFVYATLLKPLPYPQPECIYSIEVVVPERREQISSLPVRIQDYLEWRRAGTAFSSMTALRPGEWTLTGDGEPERVGGAYVSSNFFEFLGVPPALGRGFTREEEVLGSDKVIVISDSLWRRRYGANPRLIGETIKLNGENYVVVGIAAPSLLVPTGTQLSSVLTFAPRIDIWRPLAPTKGELESESWNTGLLARLKTGESAEGGRQQLEAMLNASIRAQAPDARITLLTRVVPIRDLFSGKFRTRLLLVFAASTMLLLTACTTLANLLLAKIAGRATEFAIRMAVGAGRCRLLAQLLTESTTLALAGAVAGIGAAYWTAGALSGYDPTAERLVNTSRLNLPVVLFAILMALLTGVLSGLIPGWQASRTGAAPGLREGSRSMVGGRAATVRSALVGIEIALGTALLACSALLLHSFVRLANVERGYDVEHSLTVDLALPGRSYPKPEQRVMFYRLLAASIRNLDGVEAVGAISELPAMGVSGTRAIFYQTDTDLRSVIMQRPVVGIRSVTPQYFAASLTGIKAGREFSESDQAPVAMISESLARRLWPGEPLSAIVGRAIREGDVTGPLTTICGVVGDVRLAAADRELPPQLYRPHHQRVSGRMTLVVRTSGPPTVLARPIRDVVRKSEPNLPIIALRPIQEIVAASIAQRRFEMLLTTVFATIALLLGIVGVYGVVAYSVARRTRDIGLRMVLGATPRDMVIWVLKHGLRSVFIGMLAGLCATVAIAGSLRSLLFGIGPVDPLSLGAAFLIVLVTSVLACYVPARRAAALEPAEALRVQ